MLATIGFFLTAVCFGIFAWSFESVVVNKSHIKLSHFSYAYYCLSIALFVWAVAAGIKNPEALKDSVIAGEALLLTGTIFMLSVLLGAKKQSWLWLAGLVAIVGLAIRAAHYPPDPYMKRGVLIFNTQRPVAIALSAIFAFVWLPANLKTSHMIANKFKFANLSMYYGAIYTFATISALFFLATKRPITVALSFVIVGICFALLIASNMLVERLGAKHAAK